MPALFLRVWNFGVCQGEGAYVISPQLQPWALRLWGASVVDNVSHVLSELIARETKHTLCAFTERGLSEASPSLPLDLVLGTPLPHPACPGSGITKFCKVDHSQQLWPVLWHSWQTSRAWKKIGLEWGGYSGVGCVIKKAKEQKLWGGEHKWR